MPLHDSPAPTGRRALSRRSEGHTGASHGMLSARAYRCEACHAVVSLPRRLLDLDALRTRHDESCPARSR